MTKETRISEIRTTASGVGAFPLTFGIWISVFFCHLSFIIRHSRFGHRPGGYGAVRGRPLCFGPRPSRNGTAFFAHCSAVGYMEAEAPKQLCSIFVLMIPGFNATAARPDGISCASAWVSPSMAHLVAQYGATSASVERPQPELKLTMTPLPRLIIAGTKCRVTFATPLMLVSITRDNSSTGTVHKVALRLIIPALFRSRSGAPWVPSTRPAHAF